MESERALTTENKATRGFSLTIIGHCLATTGDVQSEYVRGDGITERVQVVSGQRGPADVQALQVLQ